MKNEQIPTPSEVAAEIRAVDAQRVSNDDGAPFIGKDAKEAELRAARRPLIEKLKVAKYAEAQRREAERQAELDAAIADRSRAEQPLPALRQAYEAAATKYQAALQEYESTRDRIGHLTESIDRFRNRANESRLEVDEDPSVDDLRDTALIREAVATNLGINANHGHRYDRIPGGPIYNNGSPVCERLQHISVKANTEKDLRRYNRIADLVRRGLAGEIF